MNRIAWCMLAGGALMASGAIWIEPMPLYEHLWGQAAVLIVAGVVVGFVHAMD